MASCHNCTAGFMSLLSKTFLERGSWTRNHDLDLIGGRWLRASSKDVNS